MFAGSVGKISGFSKLKIALDEASRRHRLAAARFAANRRVARCRVSAFANHVVQAVLNHAVPGVGGLYLQDELEKQKAEALATWATALTRIVGPVRVTA